MTESKIEAAIGMSRKWEAREAGREVAETAIRTLKETRIELQNNVLR